MSDVGIYLAAEQGSTKIAAQVHKLLAQTDAKHHFELYNEPSDYIGCHRMNDRSMSAKKVIPIFTLVIASVVTLTIAGYIKHNQADDAVAESPNDQTPVVIQSEPPVVNAELDSASKPAVAETEVPASGPEANGADAAVVQEVAQAANSPQDSEALGEEIIEKLRARLPQFNFGSVVETSVAGLYQIENGGRILYVNETADYIIDGSLIRVEDRANLTDSALGLLHVGLIAGVDEKDMLIYEPDEPSDRSITVFTDISCGYCRLLHEQIDELLESGLRVRYLLYPRAGLGTQAHKDLESVWCADDPQEAMTNAKSGGVIEQLSCDNPIEQHVALASQVGLRGTPLIYTDSGEQIPGYREAKALAELVLSNEPLSASN